MSGSFKTKAQRDEEEQKEMDYCQGQTRFNEMLTKASCRAAKNTGLIEDIKQCQMDTILLRQSFFKCDEIKKHRIKTEQENKEMWEEMAFHY